MKQFSQSIFTNTKIAQSMIYTSIFWEDFMKPANLLRYNILLNVAI